MLDISKTDGRTAAADCTTRLFLGTEKTPEVELTTTTTTTISSA